MRYNRSSKDCFLGEKGELGQANFGSFTNGEYRPEDNENSDVATFIHVPGYFAGHMGSYLRDFDWLCNFCKQILRKYPRSCKLVTCKS